MIDTVKLNTFNHYNYNDENYITSFFFINTATTEIYTFPYTTLFRSARRYAHCHASPGRRQVADRAAEPALPGRSEEHTSELQSQSNIVCRHLLEKKKIDKSGRETAMEEFKSSSNICKLLTLNLLKL